MKEKRCNRKTIYGIINALDLYSRLFIGQYDYAILDYFDVRHIDYPMPHVYWTLTQKMMDIRGTLIPSLKNKTMSYSLGIWNKETPQRAIKSYDIQQVLRYQMAWHEHPEGGNTVNFGEPYIHGRWKEYCGTLRNTMYREYPVPSIITDFGEGEDAGKITYHVSDEGEKIIDDALKIQKILQSKDVDRLYTVFAIAYGYSKIKPISKDIYEFSQLILMTSHYILAFVGPSGTGKTELIKSLNIPKIITATTRPKRPDEDEGSYHFMTKEEFFNSDLVESNKYAGNYYGILREDISQSLKKSPYSSVTVDWNGVKSLRNQYGSRNVRVVYIDTDRELLENRLRMRGESEETINERMNTYDYFDSQKVKCNYLFKNNYHNIEEASVAFRDFIETNILRQKKRA